MPTPKPVPPYHTRMDAMAKGQALKPQPGKTVSTPMVNAPPADVRPKPTKPVSMTPYMNPPHTGIAKPRPIPVKLPLKPAPSLGDMARRRLAKGK